MEETEDFDFQTGTSTPWLITFGILYMKEFLVALVLYLLVFRSMALSPRTNNPTMLTVMFMFLTYLVDVAVEIEELLTHFHIAVHSTPNCRLFMFTQYGNRILQALLILFILYYNWLATYFKTYRFETLATKLYPVIVIGLLLIELILTIHPAMRVRGHESGKYCELTSTMEAHILDEWFYSILLPYWFPVIFSLPPAVYMLLKYRKGEYIEHKQTQVKLCLSISASYFLAYFLYFLLVLARQIESTTLSEPQLSTLLGASFWYITRPMFALIGHGWHICVPALCLSLDAELYKYTPRYIRREKQKRELIMEWGGKDQEGVIVDPVPQLREDPKGDDQQEYQNSAVTSSICIG